MSHGHPFYHPDAYKYDHYACPETGLVGWSDGTQEAKILDPPARVYDLEAPTFPEDYSYIELPTFDEPVPQAHPQFYACWCTKCEHWYPWTQSEYQPVPEPAVALALAWSVGFVLLLAFLKGSR